MPDELPPPIPDLSVIRSDALPPAVLETDTASRRESKELYGDDLREEQQKQILHAAFMWFIRLVAFGFMAVFLVRLAHFILPAQWSWLTDAQIQSIDKTFFSGVMGALVARYSKSALKA